MIDTTLVLDNPLCFRNNLLRLYKLIMTTEDKIRDEKLKYGINREAGKISALLSGKTDKYEYLTGEEIFPDQGRIIEKVYLFYLRKSF